MKQFDGFLKGVNLGGWISQFAQYDHRHFSTFITEKDIAYIASLGFDHVRVPVDYNVLEDETGNPLESGFAYLDNCLTWCAKHGLHMIIDLHECFGYSFDPLKKGMDRRKFFYDEALQARFLKLWTRIATRYAAYPDSVAFEPLNEVVLYDVADAWNEVIRRFIATVRAVCPNHYLIIGGVCYNSVTTVKLLDPPKDDKLVFNFHCYDPHIFTHQGAYWEETMPSDFRTGYPQSVSEYRKLQLEVTGMTGDAVFAATCEEMGPAFFEDIFAPAIAAAQQHDVPLYCGEYGVIDLADNESKLRWLQDIHTAFHAHGIGHALWNYKEKDFGLVDERFLSIKDRFIEIL